MKPRLFFLLVALSVVAVPVTAQERGGGQFWVRLFEDRDGDGVRDAGEPLITRGAAADLRDSTGTIIASARLDQSPNANQGLIGFQYLTAGQYTLLVSSPELTATTPTEFTATIQEGTLPTVVEFGGQRIGFEPSGDATASVALNAERQQTARFAIAGLGAMVAIGMMIVIGMVVYAVLTRGTPRRLIDTASRPDQG